MLEKLKSLFYKYFDYVIVGEYYDSDGKGHYRKKYNRKYYLKCLMERKKRNKRKKRGGHR